MLCETCGKLYPFTYIFINNEQEARNNLKSDTTCPACGAHDGFEYV